mgnify:CR=1 FL=1
MGSAIHRWFNNVSLQDQRFSRAALREGWKRWWAWQDSNLQPDRYERSALTIELQAPSAEGLRLAWAAQIGRAHV